MNDCEETDYTIPLGTILDGVRIDGFIDRGTFGEVYRASFGRKFKKTCALKLLSPKEGEITPELRARFEEEKNHARTRPAGPRMLRFIREGEWNGHPWFAMTLGTDVGRRLPLDTVVSIVLDVADGCERLFKAFLLHGDIKPSNIVIVGGRARLADYGSFLRIDPKDLFGHCRGSTFFVAPEVERDHVMTIRSEIFSFGRTINALADDEARRILAPVIGKASSNDPSERYGTMPELAKDVKTILREHKRLLKLQDKHHRFKTILWWCAAVTTTVGIISICIYAKNHYNDYISAKHGYSIPVSSEGYIRLVHHYYDNEKTRNYSRALDKCQKALEHESELSTDERNYLHLVMNDCILRGAHPKEAAPNRANR